MKAFFSRITAFFLAILAFFGLSPKQAKPDCYRWKAMTGSEVNDTSVIRGPAIKKAGR